MQSGFDKRSAGKNTPAQNSRNFIYRVNPTKEGKQVTIAIIKQMITLSTSGFGLVAALAWNNVIQEFIASYVKPYLPQGSSIISLLLYAFIVTTIAVTITYQLTKLVNRLEHK